MKRNLILTGILAGLLVFTYFFEEIGGKRRKEVEEEENRLFNAKELGEMVSFETVKGKIYFKDQRVFTQKLNYPVSKKRLSKFFNILSSIKVKRYLNKEEIDQDNYSLFLPDKKRRMIFEFERGKINFVLGRKMQTDPSFYMEVTTNVGTNIVLAYDDSPLEGMYFKKNAHLNSEKFERLVKLFYLDEDYFWDRAIIKNMNPHKMFEKIKSVEITNLRNRSFFVDFKKGVTTPKILKGLSPNIEYYQIFITALLSTQAKNIFHPARLKKLSKNIASIKLDLGKKMELTLFRKYGDMSGFFVRTSMENTVFEVDQNMVRLFYSNVQDFWDRRILPAFFLKKEKSFKFKINFGEELFLQMNNQDSFFITADNDSIKPKNSSFKEFFLFLSREADFVKALSPSKRTKLFSFAFHDQLFHAIFNGGDLIIENETQKLEYHYYIGDLKKFKHKKSDYFND